MRHQQDVASSLQRVVGAAVCVLAPLLTAASLLALGSAAAGRTVPWHAALQRASAMAPSFVGIARRMLLHEAPAAVLAEPLTAAALVALNLVGAC